MEKEMDKGMMNRKFWIQGLLGGSAAPSILSNGSTWLTLQNQQRYYAFPNPT